MRNKVFWKPTVEVEDRKKIFDKFKEKYYGKYSGKDRVMLELSLENGGGHYWNPIQILQIYSYLGLFENQDDIYYNFYEKLAEKFDINCNVLDVASGNIPSFGIIIAGKQMKLPNSRGTVTVCDPHLVLDDDSCNIKLIKDKFDMDIVKNYDLITGIMPCGVTRDIITSACKYNKDFFIELCGCPQEDDDYDDGKSSIDHNIEFAEEMCSKYDRDLNTDYLDFDFLGKKPIIYSKRRV